MYLPDATHLPFIQKILQNQNATDNEHYWAIDARQNHYVGSGAPGCVRAGLDLEAAYNDPEAGIIYHHSHPDERAISPPDFRVFEKPGLKQMWAHSPTGSHWGAELAEGVDRLEFKERLAGLSNWYDPRLANFHVKTNISNEMFQDIRDVATMSALKKKGWISACISPSVVAHLKVVEAESDYPTLVEFFASKLPQR